MSAPGLRTDRPAERDESLDELARSHLAWEIACVDGVPPDPDSVRLVRLLLEVENRGDTRVVLRSAPPDDWPRLGGTDASWRRLGDRLATSSSTEERSALVGPRDDLRPIVVANGAVAFQVHDWRERSLAGLVTHRLAVGAPDRRAEARAWVERLASTDATVGRLTVEQRRALVETFGSGLTLITGGPGTGKTSVVASIVRVAAQLEPEGAVALAAPTGRAADRLGRALADVLHGIDRPTPAELALRDDPPPASTVHRLLGLGRRGRQGRPSMPATLGLLIVDEGSMLDLELAELLFGGVLPTARLVVVGDPDQLPAVGVGAPFRDLMTAVPGRVVELTTTFRQSDDAGGRAVRSLAEAIRQRPAQMALPGFGGGLELPTSSPGTGLVWSGSQHLETVGRGERERVLSEWLHHLIESGLDRRLPRLEQPIGRLTGAVAEHALRVLEVHEQHRLLCAVRRAGRLDGAEEINSWLGAEFGGHGSAPTPAEPFMVTRNDPDTGLLNGEVGVAALGPGGDSLFVTRGDGGPLAFPWISVAHFVQRAWATTVHKAQGGEHDHVVLVLPERPRRPIGRTLLYTAVTRARRSIVLVGPGEVVRASGTVVESRKTGLVDALGRRSTEAVP